jgi:hypothetical protein
VATFAGRRWNGSSPVGSAATSAIQADEAEGEPFADDPGAEAEDVGVVVLDGPVVGVDVVAEGGVDAGEPGGGDAGAGAGAGDQDAAVGAVGAVGEDDGVDGLGAVRDVEGVGGKGAEVLDVCGPSRGGRRGSGLSGRGLRGRRRGRGAGGAPRWLSQVRREGRPRGG